MRFEGIVRIDALDLVEDKLAFAYPDAPADGGEEEKVPELAG